MYNFDLSRFMQQGTGTFCSCSRSGALATYISADVNSSVSVEKSTCPPIFQLTPGKNSASIEVNRFAQTSAHALFDGFR